MWDEDAVHLDIICSTYQWFGWWLSNIVRFALLARCLLIFNLETLLLLILCEKKREKNNSNKSIDLTGGLAYFAEWKKKTRIFLPSSWHFNQLFFYARCSTLSLETSTTREHTSGAKSNQMNVAQGKLKRKTHMSAAARILMSIIVRRRDRCRRWCRCSSALLYTDRRTCSHIIGKSSSRMPYDGHPIDHYHRENFTHTRRPNQ